MSGEAPKCRVIVAHRFYRVGDVIQPGAMLRNQLLQRGWVEIIPEPVAAVEPVAEIEETPLAIVEPPTQKRGRRKRNNTGDAAE